MNDKINMFFRKKKEKSIISEPAMDLSSYRVQAMPQQFLPEMMKATPPTPTKEDEFYASVEEDNKSFDKTKAIGGIIIGAGVSGFSLKNV